MSLINTINSITGVDLDTFTPRPDVGGRSAHGGYCGPAVKPIALNMVSSVAKDADVRLPISGIGGIANWRDAAEFLLLGCTTVQVCTAVMHYGFRIVEDMIDGLSNYLDEKGFRSVNEIIGRSLPSVSKWEELDLNYKIVANIDQQKCIGCGHLLRRVHRRCAPVDLGAAGAWAHALRDRGVDLRRLQPVLAGVPRRQLHLDGARRHRAGAADVEAVPGRSGRPQASGPVQQSLGLTKRKSCTT